MNPTTPRRKVAGSARVVASPSASMAVSPQHGALVVPFGGQNPLLLQAQAGAQAAAADAMFGQPAAQQPAAQQLPAVPQAAANQQAQDDVQMIERFTTEAVEFELYTDPELESHRELVPLPTKDKNRLARQTISAMRVRTHRLNHPREPERSEIMQMAQALCMRYRGLRDPANPDPTTRWVSLEIYFHNCSQFLQVS